MNTYHNKLLATVILFSFVGGLIASQEQGKKFFDESIQKDIDKISITCGAVCAQIYLLMGSCVVASGLTDLSLGDSLKKVLSDTRGLHRFGMRMLNRRIFPVVVPVTAVMSVCDIL